MKNILLVTGIYPPDIGGPATFVPQLRKRLLKMGWKVTVLCLADQAAFFSGDEEEVYRVRRNLSLFIRIPLTILLMLKLSKGKDVTFSNGLYEECAIAKSISKRPLVLKVVGNPVWERIRNSRNNSDNKFLEPDHLLLEDLSLIYKAQMSLWKWTLRKSNLIIVPSEDLKKHTFSLLSGIRCQVVENSVPVEDLPKENLVYDVITVSRLVPWKNVDVLIKAANEFGFTLAIVGEGPLMNELQQIVRSQNVKFLGKLSASDTLREVARSRIFALVSSYEGLSFALLEALAQAKPCVLSDIKSNRLVVRDFEPAIFVPVGDSYKTGEAIELILSNDLKRAEMQNESRSLILKYFNQDEKLGEFVQLIEGSLVR